MMETNPVIRFARELIQLNTVSAPENERNAARYTGEFLEKNGFLVKYPAFNDEIQVIAERGLSSATPPIILSGHLDVVPAGVQKWSVDPFGAVSKDGKLYGRGSSDMKGGIAALVYAAVGAFEEGTPAGGVRLVITSGEEQGCRGAQHLVNSGVNLGKAGALIIAEPTANIPVTGHKGGLYLNVCFSGRSAHSSMPELGDNAIYKAARAICKIEKFDFGAERDPLLGFPTVNVGTVNGGLNLNSVPDRAEFTIDVRSTKKLSHPSILERLKNELGPKAVIRILTDLHPVSTGEDEPFVKLVYEVCRINRQKDRYPKALPYLTDGAVFQKYYEGVPTVILGPGQPEMAHQTDEFCYMDKILASVTIYKEIILKWRNVYA